MTSTARHAEGANPPWFLTPVILLTMFVLPISIAGTAIALPDISRDLGDSPTALQWVVNGFNVSFALFTLVWGALSDRLGHKRTFMIGSLFILGASVLSVVSPNLYVLDAGRLLAGVGGAAVATGGTALLSNAYSGARRARAFALLGTTVGLGLAAGPTLSGGLVTFVGWQGVFAAAGAISIVALLAGGALPKDHRHPVEGNRKLIDFSPVRNRYFLAVILVPVAGSLGYVTLLTYLPVALSAVLGMSAGQAGVFLLPLTLPVLVAPVLATTLVHRVRRITPMVIINVSLAVLVVGDLGMLLLGPDAPKWTLVLPMVLLGFGWGLPIGLIDGEALAAVPARSAGAAAGVLNFVRLGSEAAAVGVYAAVTAGLLSARVDDPGLARKVSAGGSGAAGAYAEVFHLVVIALALLPLLLAVVINVLHRAHKSPAARTLSAHPDQHQEDPIADQVGTQA
ncbi:Cyanate permease [Streptomyces misionensis]|uniref:Cyanate permease n=2 Tax=Streptomyces misionensis TaxID=67331 RepID=A0A1H5EGA2_9ACTN|nr:Cyanate permease [Streptomyces misionensis]